MQWQIINNQTSQIIQYAITNKATVSARTKSYGIAAQAL